MKAVILAGGPLSTLNSENEGIPKPMITIGERPILWHIMKMFSHYGINDFLVCAGYKGFTIKEYFKDYYVYQSDITVNLQSNRIEIHNKCTEDWRVTVVDTGVDTSTGTRLLKVKEYLEGEEFFVSYGDCVSNINILEFLNYHIRNKKAATIAVGHRMGRNEVVLLDKNGMLIGEDFGVINQDSGWVNANLMVLKPEIFKYLREENISFEIDFFNMLKSENRIIAYKHSGFWSPVETKRDQTTLENLWRSGNAPWKLWDD